ncbi:MAG: peptide deformylase [Thermosediminibacterales bacterium]|nr:peptide deformylase [Thermosediminibacterales bacterium]MDK2836063.1 peptide deformylase [Thermosediminibacterales bacterium]
MTVRIIRKFDDEVLRSKAKEVKKIDESIKKLITDMVDTMYEAEGVGLAAPQIGILKKVAVIDVGDGIMHLINPVIIEEEGEEINVEGCLSFPGVFGEVKRAAKVIVEAQDLTGEKQIIKGSGLLARALQHEIDHLNGIVFIDKAIRFIDS